MTAISIAFTLFLVANPLGNSPVIVALIRDFPFERQRMIMVRESILALLLALFFQFFGEAFLTTLHIKEYAVSSCGGLLMIISATNMIFPDHSQESQKMAKRDPVFVPIATPLITGPGVLTIIMLYSHTVPDQLTLTFAILISFFVIGAVLIASPYLQKLLKKRGMQALEQLMGMVLWMVAIDMLQRGIRLFIEELAKQGVI